MLMGASVGRAAGRVPATSTLFAQAGSVLLAGLISHAPPTIASTITPGNTHNHVPHTAIAPVAAQPVDDNASVIVATRDDVCRRRNVLRLPCVRNQYWM